MIGNALSGVQLARGGVADAARGEIAEHPIGANVQTEGFDVARISSGVRFRDNGRNLDTSGLPLPEPSF